MADVVCKKMRSLDGGVMYTEFWTDRRGKRHEDDEWKRNEEDAVQFAKDRMGMSSKIQLVTIHRMPGQKILCKRKEDWR